MLTKKRFAELVGVAPHTVTRCESGSTTPEAETIAAFARVLGFPEEFFTDDAADIPFDASFRSLTSMTASLRDAALSAGAIGFLISDWVDHRFNLPPVRLPDLHLFEPETAARVLRQEWGLGEKPISNMVHLLESKGVRVFSLSEDTTKVNAYSLWRNEIPYIFLNNAKSAESSRFDAAHELGHLVLHQDGAMKGREAEDQANRFASAFLMPRSDVLARIRRVNHVNELVAEKGRWKVSVAALNYRLHKIGVTSDWKYRDLCIEIAKRGWNRNEPNEIAREASAVWEKVLRLLWQDGKTQTNLARDLNLPESEVSGLVRGLLMPSVEGRSDSFGNLHVVANATDRS